MYAGLQNMNYVFLASGLFERKLVFKVSVICVSESEANCQDFDLRVLDSFFLLEIKS